MAVFIPPINTTTPSGKAQPSRSLLRQMIFKSQVELLSSPRALPEVISPVSPEIQQRTRESLNGNYNVGEVLGTGGYSFVTVAEDRVTGTKVAVKVVQKNSLPPDEEKRVRREYALMRHLSHKHLVQFIDVIENPEQICMVMEYAEGGDLYEHLNNKYNFVMPEVEARRVFKQLVSAVAHLHRCGFSHRDIKPENVLIRANGEVFLGDLGFGTQWDARKVTSTPCGSLYYASPEILKRSPYVGPEVDVWSLGVLLYAITQGSLPFSGESVNEYRDSVLSGEFSWSEANSDAMKELVRGMLELDPLKRLTIVEVKNHPWVKGGSESASSESASSSSSSSDLSEDSGSEDEGEHEERELEASEDKSKSESKEEPTSSPKEQKHDTKESSIKEKEKKQPKAKKDKKAKQTKENNKEPVSPKDKKKKKSKRSLIRMLLSK